MNEQSNLPIDRTSQTTPVLSLPLLSLPLLAASAAAFALLLVSCTVSCTKSSREGLEPVTATNLKKMVAQGNAKLSVVNVWATWCEPCKEEMPELVKFEKQYRSKGVQLFLVSADSPSDLKAAEDFLKSAGVLFKSYRIGESPETFTRTFEPRWSATLPSTFIFDGQGRPVTFFVGKTDARSLGTKVEPLLSATLASPVKK